MKRCGLFEVEKKQVEGGTIEKPQQDEKGERQKRVQKRREMSKKMEK